MIISNDLHLYLYEYHETQSGTHHDTSRNKDTKNVIWQCEIPNVKKKKDKMIIVIRVKNVVNRTTEQTTEIVLQLHKPLFNIGSNTITIYVV